MKLDIIHFTRFILSGMIFSSCMKASTPLAPGNLSAFARSDYFTAKWSIVPHVDYYEIDVSTDNFATFIPGYQAFRVDTLSGYLSSDIRATKVTGLTPETNYQFRVRAIINHNASPNSSTARICTDPAQGSSTYVKNIADAYSLIKGTWYKYSSSATVPWYPFPDPNGISRDGISYCKEQRDKLTFNNDSTLTVWSPQGVISFSGTYKIDSAISIHGPPQYALVVRIPDYFNLDRFYKLNYYNHAYLNLAVDSTFMDLWLYSMGNGGQRDLIMSFKQYVR